MIVAGIAIGLLSLSLFALCCCRDASTGDELEQQIINDLADDPRFAALLSTRLHSTNDN